MPQTKTESDATLIGRLIIEHGLAPPDEVRTCLDQWRGAGEGRIEDLLRLLIRSDIVTRKQIKRIVADAEQTRQADQIPGYVLESMIGEGAMAAVYRGRQVSLDRVVAIKLLPKRHIHSADFVERFYAEGRAAAKLNHPNIVQAIDVGQAGDNHYFVMEYVDGHTVFDDLERRGRYDETEAVNIIIAIADALDHAHEMGFIHRDVKPKNIMITRQGVPKLADMGLARSVSDVELAEAEAGKAYGTPFYISPEQIRGLVDIDVRCDIYGLGATLYHMVTGQVPFDGASPSAVMQKHLRDELTPPDHVNAQLSTGVCEIIEMMLQKDREQRYANTADLLEDLRAVQSGEPPIHARTSFSVASLATLESGAAEAPDAARAAAAPALLEQPLFWVAAGSLLLNVILLIVLVVF